MKNKKILITGGAGFIGSHLAAKLQESGNEVTVLDNLTNGKIPPILDTNKIHFINDSTANFDLLQTIIPQHDIIFHLAAILGVRTTITHPVEMIQNNFIGTSNVLKIATDSKKKVVFASTSEVYGKAMPTFSEDMGSVYGPTTNLRWSYAIGKSLEECMCLGYGKKGLPVTIVRYFNVFGPYAKDGAYGGVIPRFISAALSGNDITVYGDGTQTRCFTYISDAVKMTILAGEKDLNQEIINIGSENIIQIKNLALKIKQLTNSSSQITYIPFEKAYPDGFEEIPYRIPNITKSKELLHYSPVVSIHEGLKETIRITIAERGV